MSLYDEASNSSSILRAFDGTNADGGVGGTFSSNWSAEDDGSSNSTTIRTAQVSVPSGTYRLLWTAEGDDMTVFIYNIAVTDGACTSQGVSVKPEISLAFSYRGRLIG